MANFIIKYVFAINWTLITIMWALLALRESESWWIWFTVAASGVNAIQQWINPTYPITIQPTLEITLKPVQIPLEVTNG